MGEGRDGNIWEKIINYTKNVHWKKEKDFQMTEK